MDECHHRARPWPADSDLSLWIAPPGSHLHCPVSGLLGESHYHPTLHTAPPASGQKCRRGGEGKLPKTTTAQQTAIESELSIARNIQLSLLPKPLTSDFSPLTSKIDLYASMTPARAVGGDLYDYYVEEGKLVFCIGDVSGKGVPAALFMSMTRSLFRAYSIGEDVPDRIVSKMNKDLTENNENCMFVTFFVGILDLATGLLRYCNAGHEAPIVINKEAYELPVDRSLPVGAYADVSYLTQTAVIEPQSTVLFYTDGLNEAVKEDVKDGSKELFSVQRILDVVNVAIQESQLSPKSLIENMTQAVHDFVGDTEQSDDLTMLCIKFI